MRQTRNTKLVQIGQIREIYGLFFFIFIFFSDSPTEVTRRPILTHNSLYYADSRKDVSFGVSTMAQHI